MIDPSAIISQISADIASMGGYDVLTIATIALLEGLLSVDNALVLAIMVKHLPPVQRRKALMYGMAGAFAFRLVALVGASYLMHLTWVKMLGGGYLLYLAMKHMFFATKEEAYEANKNVSAKSFWTTILLVEATDIVFSIDSIAAAVAMTDKLAIVWLGGIVGIFMLRAASGFFIKALDRFPRLEDLAYQLVFFVGTKLTLEGFHIELEPRIFWLTMGIIATIGASIVLRDSRERAQHLSHGDTLIAGIKNGSLKWDDFVGQKYVPTEVIVYMREAGLLQLKDAPKEPESKPAA